MFSTHLKHEEHRQHHHGHMTVPALPLAKLVTSHSYFALGVAQSLLDPVPLSLHKRKPFGRRGFGGVAEAIFDLSSRSDFPACNQMPAGPNGLFSIPEPYPVMKHLNGQGPFRAISKCHPFPFGLRLHGNPSIHSRRRSLCYSSLRRPSFHTGSLRYDRARIFGIDELVTMNVGHPRLTITIQRSKQPRFFAIPSVEAHPTIPDSLSPRVTYHLKTQLGLRTKDSLLRRDSRQITPPRRIDPLLRKIEPFVSQGDVAPAPQSSEHTHLAIVHFSQAPVPLSSHPNGLVAFFGNRALIDDQKTALRVSNRCVHILGNLIQYFSVAPGRLRNEVLERLVVGFRHHFGHALHVSLFRLDQPEQVLARLFYYVARSAGEKCAEPCVKRAQSVGNAAKEIAGTRAFSWCRRILTALAHAIGCPFVGRQNTHARVQYTTRSILSRTFCETS